MQGNFIFHAFAWNLESFHARTLLYGLNKRKSKNNSKKTQLSPELLTLQSIPYQNSNEYSLYVFEETSCCELKAKRIESFPIVCIGRVCALLVYGDMNPGFYTYKKVSYR